MASEFKENSFFFLAVTVKGLSFLKKVNYWHSREKRPLPVVQEGGKTL